MYLQHLLGGRPSCSYQLQETQLILEDDEDLIYLDSCDQECSTPDTALPAGGVGSCPSKLSVFGSSRVEVRTWTPSLSLFLVVLS